MGISSYLARLRLMIGHELVLLPSVSVIVVDQQARLLVVRHAGQRDGWAVPGGAEIARSSHTAVDERLGYLVRVPAGPMEAGHELRPVAGRRAPGPAAGEARCCS